MSKWHITRFVVSAFSRNYFSRWRACLRKKRRQEISLIWLCCGVTGTDRFSLLTLIRAYRASRERGLLPETLIFVVGRLVIGVRSLPTLLFMRLVKLTSFLLVNLTRYQYNMVTDIKSQPTLGHFPLSTFLQQTGFSYERLAGAISHISGQEVSASTLRRRAREGSRGWEKLALSGVQWLALCQICGVPPEKLHEFVRFPEKFLPVQNLEN